MMTRSVTWIILKCKNETELVLDCRTAATLHRIFAVQLSIVNLRASYWKSWVHQRLATPVGQSGAMTFYRAAPNEHLSLDKHLTAEVKTEEFLAGKGVMTPVKWSFPQHNDE
jgi:hypothetical protein